MKKSTPCIHTLIYAALGVIILGSSSNCWAQRYLTEFVGSSKITFSTTAAPARARSLTVSDDGTTPASALFNIATLGSKRDKETNAIPFKGSFTLSITDGTSNTVRAFSQNGLLFSNGDCTADLKRGRTNGNLDLVETNFDGEKKVFALIGTLGVGANLSDAVLPNGLTGTAVFIRPALVQIKLPVGSRALTLVAAGTVSQNTTTLDLTSKRRHRAVAGTFSLVSAGETFQVVASASRKWLYLAGVGTTNYFTAKLPVTRDGNVFRQATGGTYRILNTQNEVLESGSIDVGPLNQ